MVPGSIDALPFLGGSFTLAAISSRFVGEKKPKKKKRVKARMMCLVANIIRMNLRYEGFGSESNKRGYYSNSETATNRNKKPDEFDVFGSGESKAFTSAHTQSDYSKLDLPGRTNTFRRFNHLFLGAIPT